jgi:hypothetical protein
MANTAEFIEIVSELRVLKGFPRSDGEALLSIAETVCRAARGNANRARRAVRLVIETATEGWTGPAQILEALEPVEYRQPANWTPSPVECWRCNDTGAVEAGDGFACCVCPAARSAREHVEALNRVQREMRERREQARLSSSVHPGAKSDEVMRQLAIVLGEAS